MCELIVRNWWFIWFRHQKLTKTDQICDYSASSLENSSWFADVSETSFTREKTVTVAVIHKRFPRKWQTRSEVTLVWSWDSHQTVSTYSVSRKCPQTRCNQVQNVLLREPQLQTNVTSLLLCNFRGNLLWVTTTLTVLSRVEFVSNTSANQLLFSKP